MSSENSGQTVLDLAILFVVLCLFVSIAITTWDNAVSWLKRADIAEETQAVEKSQPLEGTQPAAPAPAVQER